MYRYGVQLQALTAAFYSGHIYYLLQLDDGQNMINCLVFAFNVMLHSRDRQTKLLWTEVHHAFVLGFPLKVQVKKIKRAVENMCCNCPESI